VPGGASATDRRTVLITGGASGIGFASAVALCDSGFDVALMGRRADVLAQAVSQLRERFPEVQSILDSTGEDWTTTLASGVIGSALCCAAVARHMRARRSGRMVLISSVVDSAVMPEVAAHCADKAALSSLARSLAVELAPYGIAANAIAPGWIGTEAAQEQMPEGEDWLPAINPLGRVGEPAEIANVVRYLIAEAPSFLTGATIPVDGGATARTSF
jgi:3-oxoacyl-[acyl-carrier protein] reductase